VLDRLHKTYGFEAILLDYQKDLTGVTALHYDTDFSLASPEWALVYWDDLSTLYLRRGGPYDAVIKEDEYRFVKPVNNIEGTRPRLNEKDYAEGLIKELKRNIALTGSSKAYSFLGFIFNEKGFHREAIALFDKAENKTKSTYLGLAYAYGSLNSLDESIKYYKMAFDKKKDATTLYNIGTAYSKKGDDESALKYLSDALKLDAKLTSVYPKLIQLYRKKGMNREAEETARMYENANVTAKGEEHFKEALTAYLNNKLYIAAEEYKKSIEVHPSNPEAYSNLGYVYYDMDMLTQAYEYQRKALDVDPDFANAHYGLALIYLKWNDPQSAKKHFQKYIDAEPVGYFSRRAKEEIGKIQ
jgi:tetratricopeptide (TPR) repeat protein